LAATDATYFASHREDTRAVTCRICSCPPEFANSGAGRTCCVAPACDGNLHATVRALIVANSFLTKQVDTLARARLGVALDQLHAQHQ
jgi:hypothetical protein